MAEPGAAEELLKEAGAITDARLGELAVRLGHEVPGRLGQALGYALGTAGKRVRPALVVACYRAAGGRSPGIGGVATAVEIIHTYSLVHDDLPSMDDDDQRRGRPTTHVVFDPAIAARVGYLLVPVAIEVLCRATRELGVATAIHQAIGRTLLAASGIQGMVGGQWLDLQAEGRSPGADDLTAIHARKTGALIQAACLVGGLAGGAGSEVLAALDGYGRDVGLAFQVADDVLDATATTVQLGKTAGRDASLGKSTYVGLLGVGGARAEAARLERQAIGWLDRAGVVSPSLVSLARYIVQRQS